MKNKENMTDEDVLRAAVEVAEKNGWDIDSVRMFMLRYKLPPHRDTAIYDIAIYAPEIIIFDPLFAKAFWGTEKIPIINQYNDRDDKISWKYHLQQLALAKDRLKYLKRFL